MLGKGDGTYNPPVNYTTGTSLLSGAVVDLNRDGSAGLAVANTTSASFGNGTVSVFLRVGDGSFQAGVEYETGMSPISIAAADLNGDGRGDVVVCDGQHMAVFNGKGDGSHAHHIDYPTEESPFVAIADRNGDGALDMTTADTGTVSVF